MDLLRAAVLREKGAGRETGALGKRIENFVEFITVALD